jgi:WD40 repeat protein
LPDGITSLAWSPDGRSIAAGFKPGTLEFIDASTGEIVAHSHNHERRITAITFSPDGLTMVTGSDDHTVRIWDVRTRQELATLEEHTGTIQCLTFSPDSKILVTSAQRPDGQSEVRIWPPPSTLHE